MSTSDSMKKASKKYITEKLEEIKFRVPKGKKEVFKAHAAEMNESVNAFLLRAAEETMVRDLRKNSK